jgi:glucose/arabinose dehydrogenase
MGRQNLKLRRARSLLAVALLACAARGWSQTDAQQSTPRTAPGAQLPIPGGESEPQDPMQRKVLHDAAKKRNLERQEQLTADTKKLLELAQQLKAEVDKSNKDQLSLDVVKKAEEIEKLAKSVKDKMKGGS